MGREVKAYCGCCLYGCCTVFPIIFVSAASLFTWLVIVDCNYLKITENTVYSIDTEPYTYTAGLWVVQNFNIRDSRMTHYPDGSAGLPILTDQSEGALPAVNLGTCVTWRSHDVLTIHDLDAYYYFSRSIIIVAGYSSVLLFLFVWILAFASYHKCFLHLISVAGFLQGCLTFFTFMVADSSICHDADACKVSTDSHRAIYAGIFWWATGICMALLPPFINKPFMPNFMAPFKKCGEMYVEHHKKIHKKIHTPKEQPRGTTVETVDEEINEDDGTEIIITTARTVTEEGVVIQKQVREHQLVPKKYNKKPASIRASSKEQTSGEELPLVPSIPEETPEADDEEVDQRETSVQQAKEPETPAEQDNLRPIYITPSHEGKTHSDPPTKSMEEVVHPDP